jgi:hypothetical protein
MVVYFGGGTFSFVYFYPESEYVCPPFREHEKIPSKHQYRDFMNEQHKKKSWKNRYGGGR